MKRRKEVLGNPNEDTESWKEAQSRYGTLKGELGNRISLRIGFEMIRERLIECDGDRQKMLSLQELEKGGVNCDPPTLRKKRRLSRQKMKIVKIQSWFRGIYLEQ